MAKKQVVKSSTKKSAAKKSVTKKAPAKRTQSAVKCEKCGGHVGSKKVLGQVLCDCPSIEEVFSPDVDEVEVVGTSSQYQAPIAEEPWHKFAAPTGPGNHSTGMVVYNKEAAETGAGVAEEVKAASDVATVDEAPETVETSSGEPVKSEQASGPENIRNIYDRLQKLVFLVDVSGSIADSVMPEDPTILYDWSGGVLQEFRDKIQQTLFDAAKKEFPDHADADISKSVAESIGKFNLADDESLKKYVIERRLHKELGIYLGRNWSFDRKSHNVPSKLEIIKSAIKTYIEQRFAKYPDALIGLYEFNMHANVLCHPGAKKDEILKKVDEMYPHGGTRIMDAVNAVIQDFKKSPSVVGTHHIVLVSDGQDSTAGRIEQSLHIFKKMNIVFDFLYLQGCDIDDSGSGVTVRAIERVTKETGGEYSVVNKAKDFEDKFLQMGHRPALPPASGL